MACSRQCHSTHDYKYTNILKAYIFLFSNTIPKGFMMRKVGPEVYSVTYLTSGTYTFKCVVTDNDGMKATGYTSVIVSAGRLQLYTYV